MFTRRLGRVHIMTFDLGTRIAVSLTGAKLAMSEVVDTPYGAEQVRAAVRRLIPKYRAYLKARHPSLLRDKAPARPKPSTW